MIQVHLYLTDQCVVLQGPFDVKKAKWVPFSPRLSSAFFPLRSIWQFINPNYQRLNCGFKFRALKHGTASKRAVNFNLLRKIAFYIMIFHVFLLILLFNYKTNFVRKRHVLVKALEERELHHIKKSNK